MTEQELKDRTKRFSLRVLKLVDTLPDSRAGRVLASQHCRSGTSVGANYRAACRSRSAAEMISRLSVVEEEADESAFWMELIVDHGLLAEPKISPLLREAGEITAIMVSSRRTLQAGSRKSGIQNRK